MASIISASIDVEKLSHLIRDGRGVTKGKNGKRYLAITVTVNNEPNEWGSDASISISQTQEERQSRAKKDFIGNGKTVWSDHQTNDDPIF